MINKIHDSFFKGLFSVKENLQDLVRGTLPPELGDQLRLDTLSIDPNEYVDKELAPHFKDICCNVKFKEDRIKISLLFEHKSFPDPYIHLQLLQYMLNVWEYQIEEDLELTPVVCIVFFHGVKQWQHTKIINNIPSDIRPYVPAFDFVLFNTKDYGDGEIVQLFQTPPVRLGVWLLKRSHNLLEFIQKNPELAREMLRNLVAVDQRNAQRIVLYLYNVSDMAHDKIDRIMKTVTPEVKDILEVYRLQYLEEGKEQTALTVARKLIARGDSDEQIAELVDLSLERIKQLRAESPT